MISRIKPWDPVPGDDGPMVTFNYRDVPEGFRISDLVPLSGCPLTAQHWDRLTRFADDHYRNHEIIGQTFVDFYENLRDSYYMNADTLEKALEVYYDDIAKPTQSRTIRRTHTETETLPNGSSETTTQYGHSIATESDQDSESTDIEYGIEGSDSSPSAKTQGTTSGTGSENHSGTDKTTVQNNGGVREFDSEDTEDWSDVGVAPNYELMNGFLDNNRTMERIFTSFFEDCFTLQSSFRW